MCISKCCQSSIRIEGNGTTNWAVCTKCEKPCDFSYKVVYSLCSSDGHFEGLDVLDSKNIIRDNEEWDIENGISKVFYRNRMGRFDSFLYCDKEEMV